MRTSTKDIIRALDIKENVDSDGRPKYWPILKAGDIGRVLLSHFDESPCCSLGWIAFITEEYDPSFYYTIDFTLRNNLGELGIKWGDLGLMNDKATPLQRVLAWNKTGKDLGYTEIE